MTGTDPAGLLDRRLLIVSGKGGTGKTTVAAACATAAAAAGHRVLLAEVEGRDGVSELLRVPPPGFAERRTPFGFRILSITPREALLEYLWVFFRMGALARALRRAKVLETATEAVPGFRDLMTCGKLYELTEWRDRTAERAARDRRPYDLVVVDAPPTGQLVQFLRGPGAFRELIRVGRPTRQLASIDGLIRRRSRIALVAVPEEMSVVETAETAEALVAEGFPRPTIVANRVAPPVFPRGTAAAARRLDLPAVREALVAARVAVAEDAAEDLLRSALVEGERAKAQARFLARLRKAGPVVELPFLYAEHVGPAEVRTLASILEPA